MSEFENKAGLEEELKNFVKKGFSPQYDELKDTFPSKPHWQKLNEVGSRLWLDSGNIEEIEKFWTRQFSAVTTNNTLLNKEIQSGRYDSLIPEIMKILNSYPQLDERKKILEINFVLNAWHGLRLVEKFDANVSVEEHTDLANDVDLAVRYGERFYAICPERFYIKVPFTPAGLLATCKLSADGIPVNHTLGFSARQNYVIARIARPAYVNVFLGRLNSLIVDNKLGDGAYVGEKATLASQNIIEDLRQKDLTPAHQIGASFRSGRQVLDLAGIDVMTMPPKVAGEFLDLGVDLDSIIDKVDSQYSVGVNKDVDVEAIRLDTLWNVDEKLVACVNALEKENLDSFTPDDLIDFFAEHRCGDVLVRWDASQIETSYKEGKIPRIVNWADVLKSKQIGLDALMNLAGLNSFRSDQDAMDDRIRRLLGSGGVA
ncbi:MAG: transaldolase family protein [Sedimentisphaerales bacterium]|nr:transaldolase family protein [Sedimentisphaerales bacterium]